MVNKTIKKKVFLMKLNNNTYNYLETLNPEIKKLNVNDNKPVLFNQKIKKNIIKPLNYLGSDTGLVRHFTPAAQEWFNSIYAYNINYTKGLVVSDTNLIKLLKSYFNMKPIFKFFKEKRVPMRFKRIRTNKIFVGRGNIKHTYNQVIITFCVHNAEKQFLKNALETTYKTLYFPKKRLEKTISHKDNDKNNKSIISYNRTLSLAEYLFLEEHRNKWYTDYAWKYVEIKNLTLTILVLQYEILTKLENMGLISMDYKNKMFISLCYNNLDKYNHPSFSNYMVLAKNHYKAKLWMYRYSLVFNKNKFSQLFMSKLVTLVEKMYNKKVVFNIINLKKLHLSTDIFTQIFAMKLRNRKNRLRKTLNSFFRRIKVREINKLLYKGYKFNKDDILANNIRNKYVISMFKPNSGDSLNELLLNFIPSIDNLKQKVQIRKDNSATKVIRTSLYGFVWLNLKNRHLRGVRIEVKGRLSKRFTASRSMFKMKYKGGLKNVDSSFKGISAILLRGHFKSNVQYSYVGSRNRNGSFGVKGWVGAE